MKKNKIIDHRGAQIRYRKATDFLPECIEFVVHPENTLASLKESFETGHNAELDVQCNVAGNFERGGETVNYQGQEVPFLPVYHDDQLGAPDSAEGNPFYPSDGTLCGERLKNLPAETIQTARFDPEGLTQRVIYRRFSEIAIFRPGQPDSIVYLDESAAATRIPTLDEVFGLLKLYPDRHLFVELKTLSQGAAEDTKEREDRKKIAEKAVRLVKIYELQDQVTMVSFNRDVLENVNAQANFYGLTGLTTGYDIEPESCLNNKAGREEMLCWAKRNVNIILPAYEETDQTLVEDAHCLGLQIISWVWKDNRSGELTAIPRLLSEGVDGVITNVPSDAERFIF